MATVYLLSAADAEAPGRPYAFDPLQRLQSAAQKDRYGEHSVTDDPEAADIILFVENCGTFHHFFHEVRHHPLYRRYPGKCFMHTRTDYPVPFLPGIYTSLRQRWYDPQRVRAGMYLVAFDHGFTQYDGGTTAREYLYSFIGKTNTHPVREKIMLLDHPAQFLFDTTPYWPYGDLPPDMKEALETQYQDVALKSHFILCPRGFGTSSIRLFESLRMGRVPVILSDQWVAPTGPDWDAFSILIPEADVAQLPQILSERVDEAPTMGKRARKAYEAYFAEEAIFHRVAEWCLQLQAGRSWPVMLHRLRIIPQLVHPRYARMLLRTLVPEWLKAQVQDMR